MLWPVVERAFGKSLLPGLNALRSDRRAAAVPLAAGPVGSRRDLVLGLTGSPLEYPRHRLPANVALVGSQPWDPPAPAPAYLDEPGDPWVLVTCSTDYQGDESLARVAVEALRNEPYRVLLTLADAYDGADLPAADNVVATRFVSHAAVLPRAAAVVTHAGMGIVGKATYAGVPIVAVPFGRDQPEIARRIVEAGTGVRLPARKLTAGAPTRGCPVGGGPPAASPGRGRGPAAGRAGGRLRRRGQRPARPVPGRRLSVWRVVPRSRGTTRARSWGRQRSILISRLRILPVGPLGRAPKRTIRGNL